ncbi:ribonuclease H-like domain-containing protein [Tanacetum coccineum]
MDLKWQLALLSMRTRRFFQKTIRKITINGSDTDRYDKSKVECFNCHKIGYFARECRGPRNQDSRKRNQDSSRRTVNVKETSSKAMVAIDEADFEVHNDKTCSKTYLKSFETLKTQLDDLRIEFNKSEFNLATYKRGLASVEEQLVFYKKNEVIFCEQLAVLKRDISYKDSEISMLKSELEKLKQEKESNQLKIENFDNASKSLDKLLGSQIPEKSRKDVGFVSYNVVPPPPTGLFSPLKLDLPNSGLEEFQQPEFEGYGPKPSKSVSEDTSNEVRESDRLTAITIKGKGWNMFPRAVLMKTGLRTLNTARPVNTAHPKTTVYSARPMSCFSKSAQSIVKRQKAVNTTGPNSTVVNAVRANKVNAVKASAYWVWRPTKLNSASITFKRHNYVDARGKSKTCPISQTSRILMKDVLPLGEEPKKGKLLVKELLKLVLLKVPRKNNMYSVDMKNIVPKESLTCLVAKATLDELMLWHRRPDTKHRKHVLALCLKDSNTKPLYLLGFLFRQLDELVAFLRALKLRKEKLVNKNSISRTGRLERGLQCGLDDRFRQAERSTLSSSVISLSVKSLLRIYAFRYELGHDTE